MKKSKRGPGRPPSVPLPEVIPDTPENVARAILSTPPKKRADWKFLNQGERGGTRTRVTGTANTGA